MKVGFIGVGTIGEHMCRCILKAKHDVAVFDLNQAPIKRLASEGAVAKRNPKEVAEASEAIILMVVNDKQIRQVISGENGLISGIKPKSTVIIMSTVNPEVCKEMAKVVESAGCSLIEAPVVKSQYHASIGELGIYVGGPLETFNKARPILECMGKNIIRMGEVGAGMAMKLCHNMLTAEIDMAVSEMLTLGRRAGLQFDDIVTAISFGGAQTFYLDTKGETIKKRDFTVRFAVEHMDKDVGLALALGDSLKANLPGASAAKELFKAAVAMGHSKEDWSALIKVIEKLSGL